MFIATVHILLSPLLTKFLFILVPVFLMVPLGELSNFNKVSSIFCMKFGSQRGLTWVWTTIAIHSLVSSSTSCGSCWDLCIPRWCTYAHFFEILQWPCASPPMLWFQILETDCRHEQPQREHWLDLVAHNSEKSIASLKRRSCWWSGPWLLDLINFWEHSSS